MCEIQTGWDGGQQERKKKKKERNGNAHTSFDNLRRQEQTAVYPEIRVDWSQTADDLRREEPKGTASSASTLTVVVLVRRQGRGFDEQPPRQCADQADLAVWEDFAVCLVDFVGPVEREKDAAVRGHRGQARPRNGPRFGGAEVLEAHDV